MTTLTHRSAIAIHRRSGLGSVIVDLRGFPRFSALARAPMDIGSCRRASTKLSKVLVTLKVEARMREPSAVRPLLHRHLRANLQS